MTVPRSACTAALALALIAVPALAQVTFSTVPDDFVLFVNFDEGSGDTLVDHSSYEHNLELVNGSADWVSDKDTGKAMEFDGETAFQVEKTDVLASFMDTISVGAWVRLSATDGWRNIIEMDNTDGGNEAWKVGFADGGAPVFTTYRVKDHIATGVVEMDEWHHVACTYDGDGGTATFYIDGEIDSEVAGGGFFDTSADDVTSMDIGWRGNSAASFMSGAMDQLWVSMDVKSPAEVKDLMGGIILGVDPAGKTATTWGHMKGR
ncbi:LamG domain-containing protein [Candidatus Poribacteria bacterium]|jgi:hypothetical protein|nr:LamG domain-containing protein [Candidatus Poribacteria bacterium]MBT5536265.1 LamG domain-containing protein [Candidatus Poribacteria bacterium]MBT7804795.1 LamG domain-containing protein [Candidatus Poribacteria bacterium]